MLLLNISGSFYHKSQTFVEEFVELLATDFVNYCKMALGRITLQRTWVCACKLSSNRRIRLRGVIRFHDSKQDCRYNVVFPPASPPMACHITYYRNQNSFVVLLQVCIGVNCYPIVKCFHRRVNRMYDIL